MPNFSVFFVVFFPSLCLTIHALYVSLYLPVIICLGYANIFFFKRVTINLNIALGKMADVGEQRTSASYVVKSSVPVKVSFH